ncbi:transporter substrate-binding domain-containing protein [Aeromonas veronii]|uniref:transporter substrate-binding domain-containing protein n=1 Tax=Aeromonas veronii TaxID=654 RepID=UPI0031FC91B5
MDYSKMPLSLSTIEKEWLHKKKKLILAVPVPDNPPMDITLRSGEYEGVTADILGVIEKQLGIDIIAKTFPSRADAIEAVLQGRADMIGSSNSYEIGAGLALTSPYIADEPVVYKRFGVARDKIKTLAVPDSYLPFSEVIRYFPGVKIITFPSRYGAVSAVAYGKADAVLIDMISGNFLINKYYQDEIQLDKPVYANTSGFSFGINNENSMLLNILNEVLTGVTELNSNSVIKRWSGGGMSIQSKPLQLTDAEWQFLHDKGKLKIGVGTVLPPLSFIDEQNNFHGVVSDLFQVISAKLGIDIEPIMLSYANDEQISALESGRVDAAIMSASDKRRRQYLFSKAFYVEPLVYVMKRTDAIIEPESVLKLGKVAILRGFISIFDNHSFFGEVNNPEYFDRIESALSCIAQGNCDMTIIPLRTAKFYINSKSDFRAKLVISGELFNSVPLTANFAFEKNNKILLDIFDKVIYSIPPDELESLATRSRVSERTYLFTLQDLLREFGLAILIIILALIGSAGWLLLLRRQISHRKKAEMALNAQLQFVAELIDSMPHPIYAFDSSRNLILCNHSFSSILGTSKEKILNNKNLNYLVSSYPFIELLGTAISNSLDEGNSLEGDSQLTFTSHTIDIYHWSQPYRDTSGNIQGVVGGWIDVSDRVALVRKLAEAMQNAEDASRAKSTFLATMSHEIRTPMNAIIGLLELTLRKKTLNIEDQEYISIAYQSSHDLLGLIGDILDISKIESGKLELVPSSHSIINLSHSVVNVFSVIARQKGLTLTLNCIDDYIVMVDPVRYKQVLSNLISNSLKFTSSGGVTIDLNLYRTDDLCKVLLTVADSGIGIEKKDLELLFQPFTQAKQPQELKQTGAGLGLLISRDLCQKMDGDLKITSEVGVGTTATVTLVLPLATITTEDQVDNTTDTDFETSNSTLSILIIDDHPTNRLLVSQQLTYLGHSVLEAASGREALELLVHKFADIIITDFNMPDINGLEFTKYYRERENIERRERAVIIGLTADARHEQIHSAVQLGMDDCLFKPVSLDELKFVLNKHDPSYRHANASHTSRQIGQALKKLTLDNPQLTYSLLIEFMHASEQDLNNLTKACENDDTQDFLLSLHRLKGGARILGADDLVNCCKNWEMSSRLSWCLASALRQITEHYKKLQEGIHYWLEINGFSVD